MRKNFLFYAKGYAHKYDTSNPYYHGKSSEFSIKGTTPELYDKMKEVSEMLDDDEIAIVIKEEYLNKCIEDSYVQPALRLREYRDEGKIIINGHLFALYMFLFAVAPFLIFLVVK